MELSHSQALEILHTSLPDSLLQNYGLSKAQTTNVSNIGQLIPLLIDFKTDELFSASTNRFNREFTKVGGKVYSYHFDRGNQFPGPMNNVAHHALDLEYVFGTSQTDSKIRRMLN